MPSAKMQAAPKKPKPAQASLREANLPAAFDPANFKRIKTESANRKEDINTKVAARLYQTIKTELLKQITSALVKLGQASDGPKSLVFPIGINLIANLPISKKNLTRLDLTIIQKTLSNILKKKLAPKGYQVEVVGSSGIKAANLNVYIGLVKGIELAPIIAEHAKLDGTEFDA